MQSQIKRVKHTKINMYLKLTTNKVWKMECTNEVSVVCPTDSVRNKKKKKTIIRQNLGQKMLF